MSRFSAPHGLDEALQALAGGARIVAGGTDLVVGVRQGRGALPEDLVAVHRLEALRGIGTWEAGGLHIGAGTNLGDRRANLAGALRALAELGEITGVSSVYETDPVGDPDQPVFWNLVVRLQTGLEPRALSLPATRSDDS